MNREVKIETENQNNEKFQVGLQNIYRCRIDEIISKALIRI